MSENEEPEATAPESGSGHYRTVDPDVRLMLEVQAGSAAAFELLVRRYQRRIVAFISQFVAADSAEDLAQEVFMRVYRSRATYRPGARFSTWLYTIAHNVANNASRKASRNREMQAWQAAGDSQVFWSMEALAQAPSGQMPIRQLDKLELSEVVSLAMRSLNERQRMAVYLSKFEGMGYQEIADTMELSAKAVKSLLSRARANLRDILQPYFDTGRLPSAPAMPDAGGGPSGPEEESE